MKIPFPIKVFLSYLIILSFVAIPIGLYLAISFSDQMVEQRSLEIIEKTEALESSLEGLAPQERVVFLRQLASVYPEDISFFDAKGGTLFTSNSELKNIRLQNPKKVIRHFSKGMEYVVVTRILPKSKDAIQLAYPLSKITSLTAKLVGVFRNALAAAITLALLFSLLASFVFLRPLRRLVKSANALAEGKFDATEKWDNNDEISDVGRALNALALKIRVKLAGAYAAENILSQVIEKMDNCVAVFNDENELIVASGVFHEELNGEFSEVIGKWTHSKKWAKARQAAELSAKGIALKWTKKSLSLDLELHKLDHGRSAPFWMLSPVDNSHVRLPEPEDCEVITIASLLQYFDEKLDIRGLEANIDFDIEKTVVDHANRIPLVFSIVFASSKRKMNVNFEKYFSKISVRIDTVLEDAELQLCQDLLRPIDSEVKIDHDSTIIWLRRA